MQNTTPDDHKDQTVFTPLMNSEPGSQQPLNNMANGAPPENKSSFFYTQDDELDLHLPPVEEHDDQANLSSPFVLPFQNSAALPTVATMNTHGAQGSIGTTPPPATSAGKTPQISLRLLKIFLIASLVVLTVIGASFFVFAQQASFPGTNQTKGMPANKPLQTKVVSTSIPNHVPTTQPKSAPAGSSKATDNPSTDQGPDNQNQEQTAGTFPQSSIPSAQLLKQIGWTEADLSSGDAIEMLRTSTTFTEREMSYDYRNIGTLAVHSGTLTGSTFLLTAGGKLRFVQNDIRMINNVLYNKIQTGKIIQQVVNAQPSLVQFQLVLIQGQPHQFAWVNVAFELFQSKIDPANGQRTERLELNSTTGQPIIHHLTVVLVRVSPQNQGRNAPMGGTGWLVDTYALDTNTLPAIATTPSL